MEDIKCHSGWILQEAKCFFFVECCLPEPTKKNQAFNKPFFPAIHPKSKGKKLQIAFPENEFMPSTSCRRLLPPSLVVMSSFAAKGLDQYFPLIRPQVSASLPVEETAVMLRTFAEIKYVIKSHFFDKYKNVKKRNS